MKNVLIRAIVLSLALVVPVMSVEQMSKEAVPALLPMLFTKIAHVDTH